MIYKFKFIISLNFSFTKKMGGKSGYKPLLEEQYHEDIFNGKIIAVDENGLVYRFGTNFLKSKTKDNKEKEEKEN